MLGIRIRIREMVQLLSAEENKGVSSKYKVGARVPVVSSVVVVSRTPIYGCFLNQGLQPLAVHLLELYPESRARERQRKIKERKKKTKGIMKKEGKEGLVE